MYFTCLHSCVSLSNGGTFFYLMALVRILKILEDELHIANLKIINHSKDKNHIDFLVGH